MDKCRIDCKHRAMIEEYRVERHRQEMIEEVETLGYATELKMRREEGLRPITFKEWICGLRHDEPEHREPAEDPGDLADAYAAAGW